MLASGRRAPGPQAPVLTAPALTAPASYGTGTYGTGAPAPTSTVSTYPTRRRPGTWARGAYRGRSIGQYAMSELDGYLRVATTVGRAHARAGGRGGGPGPAIGQHGQRPATSGRCPGDGGVACTAWAKARRSMRALHGRPRLRGHFRPDRPALRSGPEQPRSACAGRPGLAVGVLVVAPAAEHRPAPGGRPIGGPAVAHSRGCRSRCSTWRTRPVLLSCRSSSSVTAPARRPSTTRTLCCGGRRTICWSCRSTTIRARDLERGRRLVGEPVGHCWNRSGL